MNVYEAQEMFQNIYSGKKVSLEFDDNCHRTIEAVFTDGLPNLMHHVECRKVKVNVEGVEPFYAPIEPHRLTTSWASAKSYLNSKTDVHIPQEDLTAMNAIQDPQEKQLAIQQRADLAGLPIEHIQSKIDSIKIS